MKKFIEKNRYYLNRFGILEFIIKVPRAIFRTILIRFNTLLWSIRLGELGSSSKIHLGVRIYMPNNVFIGQNVIIGKNVVIGTENTNGILRVENNVQINNNCEIDHSGDLTIGENSLLSAHTTIFTHSHGYDPRSISVGKPKQIGKNVWLGYRSMILDSVEYIADECIIGAGSIVTANCVTTGIYVGTPATKKKELN